MRKIAVGVLILAVGLVMPVGCAHRPKQEKAALALPQGTPKRPQGMAALTVKAGEAQPFSREDVADYFKTHNLPKNLSSMSEFQVDALEFLTNKAVSDRLRGASPGLGDEERVGFVTLRGVFVFTGPPPGKPVRFTRAYAVFDATTGNLLMAGTLEPGERGR